jgi:LmbE family N-acetylglucosaminyl deacetylase
MRVLVVVAHPDDTEFISGGTIASMVDRGDEVAYLVATSGELGLPVDEGDLLVREKEQRLAATELGVSHVEFLREPDGRVVDSIDLRRKLVSAIRRTQPELVLTHSPIHNLTSVRYSHTDHLAVGRATLASVFPEARNPRFHPELVSAGMMPWIVTEVWLSGVEKPNLAIDISRHFAKKLAAIRMHVSQARHFKDASGFFREWAEEVAMRHNLPAGTLAEEFHRVSAT